MIKKLISAIALAACTTFATVGASATLISYAGYTTDTNSAVITGDGVEWLRWDKTIGMTLEQALQHTAAGGWRVAYNWEVTKIMQDFGLFRPQSQWFFPEHDTFIEMFGVTYMSDTTRPIDHVAPDGTILAYGYKEGQTMANARDANGYFSSATLQWGLYNMDHEQFIIDTEHVTTHQYQGSQWLSGSGVALIRSNVSESNPLPLIALAIGIMLFSRRIKKSQFKYL